MLGPAEPTATLRGIDTPAGRSAPCTAPPATGAAAAAAWSATAARRSIVPSSARGARPRSCRRSASSAPCAGASRRSPTWRACWLRCARPAPRSHGRPSRCQRQAAPDGAAPTSTPRGRSARWAAAMRRSGAQLGLGCALSTPSSTMGVPPRRNRRPKLQHLSRTTARTRGQALRRRFWFEARSWAFTPRRLRQCFFAMGGRAAAALRPLAAGQQQPTSPFSLRCFFWPEARCATRSVRGGGFHKRCCRALSRR